MNPETEGLVDELVFSTPEAAEDYGRKICTVFSSSFTYVVELSAHPLQALQTPTQSLPGGIPADYGTPDQEESDDPGSLSQSKSMKIKMGNEGLDARLDKKVMKGRAEDRKRIEENSVKRRRTDDLDEQRDDAEADGAAARAQIWENHRQTMLTRQAAHLADVQRLAQQVQGI